MKARVDFSPEWLAAFKDTFEYNKETGHITYKIYYRGNQKGSRADNINSLGTRACIDFKRIRIYSTRAAFFLVEGVMPNSSTVIDHINGDTLINKWDNLRAVTKAQNNFNKSLSRINTSGVKGISKLPSGEYYVQIMTNGVQKQKRFENKSEAVDWIIALRNQLHGEFANHG